MISLTNEEAALLLVLDATTSPVGSRRAVNALRSQGFALSESTVSRLLRRLDDQRLTESVGSKGRVLTQEGRRLVASHSERDRREQILQDAAGITDLTELLDLLYARRGVEREAARGAAERVTDGDIARLEAMVADHQAAIAEQRVVRHSALAFHQVIGELAGNRVLTAMMEVLFEPVMDQTEAVLDVIIGSHHSEPESVEEHVEIVRAIAARDPERADAAMALHLSRLIAETERFAATHHPDLVERILSWMNAEMAPNGYQSPPG
jgi:DNA-binding FadR family transcriptional regulator